MSGDGAGGRGIRSARNADSAGGQQTIFLEREESGYRGTVFFLAKGPPCPISSLIRDQFTRVRTVKNQNPTEDR